MRDNPKQYLPIYDKLLIIKSGYTKQPGASQSQWGNQPSTGRCGEKAKKGVK